VLEQRGRHIDEHRFAVALVRLNLRPDFLWRMVVLPKFDRGFSAHHALLQTGRRPILQLHAE